MIKPRYKVHQSGGEKKQQNKTKKQTERERNLMHKYIIKLMYIYFFSEEVQDNKTCD